MIVQAMVYDVFGNPRRDDDRWNSRTILLKREAVLVVTNAWARVSRSNSCWRNSVVVEPAVLVPGNDENAVVPYRGIPYGFIRRLDQPLAQPDIVERMLRRAPFVVIEQAVARFDKDIVVRERSLQVSREMLVLPDVAKVNTL